MFQKGIRYRIYPNKKQKEQLETFFGCNRFVWNYFLSQRKENYLKYKEDKLTKRQSSFSYVRDSKDLTQLKRGKEFKWLKEGIATTYQQTLRDLERAYVRFFKKQSRFPRFKKKKAINSFRLTSQVFKISDKKIFIPKLAKGIKVKQHKELEGQIINATVTKTAAERYFVSIICKFKPKRLRKNNKKVGIDLGLKDLLVCSDGTRFKNIKILNRHTSKLKYLQRQLSKKKRGSNNKDRARKKVAKINEKIQNTRHYYLHKITSKIVNENQVVCLENLNIKGMMKNRCLAKAISDVSWGEIVRQLEYKSKWHGRELVKIERFFPSSKMCGNCKFINEDLKLSDREWECEQCNTVHNRDINASKNILKQGLNLQTVGSDSIESLGSCRR